MSYALINGAEINDIEAQSSPAANLDRSIFVSSISGTVFGGTIAIPGIAPPNISLRVSSLGSVANFGAASIVHGVVVPADSMGSHVVFGAVIAQMSQPAQSLLSVQFGFTEAIKISGVAGIAYVTRFGQVDPVRVQQFTGHIGSAKFGFALLKGITIGPVIGGLFSVGIGDPIVGAISNRVFSIPTSVRFGKVILQRIGLC